MHQEEACIRTRLLKGLNLVFYPFFAHFPIFFAHFQRLDARNPDAKSPGENEKNRENSGKTGVNGLGMMVTARARCSQIVEKLESLRGAE